MLALSDLLATQAHEVERVREKERERNQKSLQVLDRIDIYGALKTGGDSKTLENWQTRTEQEQN